MINLILALLPTLLTLVKWMVEKSNMDKQNKAQFLDLIEKAKLDPGICLRMKDDVKSAKDELHAGGGQ